MRTTPEAPHDPLCGRLYLIERYLKEHEHEYDCDRIKDIRNVLGRRIASIFQKGSCEK